MIWHCGNGISLDCTIIQNTQQNLPCYDKTAALTKVQSNASTGNQTNNHQDNGTKEMQ